MKLVKVSIDGRAVTVAEGSTVLDAARTLGIEIPTLCHRDGLPHYTSCMVCAVRDLASGRWIPACSQPVAEGMEIEASSELVHRARQRILELLLSEHLGDCEAPCRRACPASLRIPEMCRLTREGRLDEAARLVVEDLILPVALGWVCPAPCERTCRRADHDRALAIRELHRRLGCSPDTAAVRTPRWPPRIGPTVAVIGGGPSGISAAVALRRRGYAVHVFERSSRLGGGLWASPAAANPKFAQAFAAELEQHVGVEIEWHLNTPIETAEELNHICSSHAATVLALGSIEPEQSRAWGLARGARGLIVDPATRQTNLPGVFAAGGVVQPGKMAVRSIADGQRVAAAVAGYVRTGHPTVWVSRFDSRVGRLEPGEVQQWVPDGGPDRGAFPGEMRSEQLDAATIAEAARCFGCDCRKAATCQLRRYADQYGADAHRFESPTRPPVILRRDHPQVVYEPGKCIRCGICVRIAAAAGEPLGMTFQGRGYSEQVAPSFNDGLEAGLGRVWRECVAACPTAALALRDRWDPMGPDHIER